MVDWHKSHKLCNFPRVGHLITLNNIDLHVLEIYTLVVAWEGMLISFALTGTIGKHFKVLKYGCISFPNPGHFKFSQSFEIHYSQTSSNLRNRC